MRLRILNDIVEGVGESRLCATESGAIVKLWYTDNGDLAHVEAYDHRSAGSEEIELPEDIEAAIQLVEKNRQPWNSFLPGYSPEDIGQEEFDETETEIVES